MRLILTALIAVAVPARADVAADAATLLDAYRAAWANSDAAALARLFTPDADLLSLAGGATGTAPIAALYAGAFAQTGKSSITTRLDRVRTVTRDVAYGRGRYTLTPDGASAPFACGSFVAVLRHERSGWRIAAFGEAALACPKFRPSIGGMSDGAMTIGGLARAAGVGVETIRYYERLGLIDQPRVRSGYRRYDARQLRKLEYIRNAKALRLSLRDIAALQAQLDGGPAFCAAVRGLVSARLAEVDHQLAALTGQRRDLDAFLSRCAARGPGVPCPVARDLAP